jgi:hypothetical protein
MNPVNGYGRTKMLAEEAIQGTWTNFGATDTSAPLHRERSGPGGLTREVERKPFKPPPMRPGGAIKVECRAVLCWTELSPTATAPCGLRLTRIQYDACELDPRVGTMASQ